MAWSGMLVLVGGVFAGVVIRAFLTVWLERRQHHRLRTSRSGIVGVVCPTVALAAAVRRVSF